MLFIEDNMSKNKNNIIHYMPRKISKSLRSKTPKKSKVSKQIKKSKGKSKKVILTKGKYSFKRTRKQKGGSSLPETDLMLQNVSEKMSATQNIIEGTRVSVSGKAWVQPELTKY